MRVSVDRLLVRLPALVTVAVTASLAAGAVSAPAAATPRSSTCRVSGVKVVHGKLAKLSGPRPTSTTVGAGGAVRRLVAYRAMESTEVKSLSSTATIARGTNVLLACYGTAVGQPAINPDLSIMHGTVTVHDAGKRPLGVLTLAALVTPYEGELAAHPKLGYVVKDHESNTQFPTTVLHTLRGTPSINVTPYAGPRPGSCRHAIWAKLVYNPNNGGTATYKLGP